MQEQAWLVMDRRRSFRRIRCVGGLGRIYRRDLYDMLEILACRGVMAAAKCPHARPPAGPPALTIDKV